MLLFFISSIKCYVGSNKKSRCSALITEVYRSYICLGREKMVHAKKEEGEKIKLKYDERKKFLYKPRSVIVYIVCIVVSIFPNLCGSFYLY
jgi:hypothetical protein